MALPVLTKSMSDDELETMMKSARDATNFMKALAHEGRLMILCHLSTGEKSVTELEELLYTVEQAAANDCVDERVHALVDEVEAALAQLTQDQ